MSQNHVPTENDYKDVTSRANPGQRLRRPRFNKVCWLSKLISGDFCFPYGQATVCSDTKITIKKGESKSLKGGFSLQGFSVEASTTHTAEQTTEYPTDKCSICEPQVCYVGQIQTWDCETSYGYFGTHKYTETHFVPTSRGYFNVNCRKDPRCCAQHPECCKEKTAMVIPGTGNYIQIDENPAVAMLVNFTDFRLSRDRTSDNLNNISEIPDEKLVKSFSNDMESLVGETTMDNRAVQQVGIMDSSGEVSWIYGSPLAHSEPKLTIVSGDSNEKTRDAMLVDNRSPILPVLAIGPCKANYTIRLTVTLTPFGKGETKTVYDDKPEIISNRIMTVWRKINLSNETLDSYGMISLEIYDKKSNCPISRTTKPFIYRKSPQITRV